jgi:hypothetical protein
VFCFLESTIPTGLLASSCIQPFPQATGFFLQSTIPTGYWLLPAVHHSHRSSWSQPFPHATCFFLDGCCRFHTCLSVGDYTCHTRIPVGTDLMWPFKFVQACTNGRCSAIINLGDAIDRSVRSPQAPLSFLSCWSMCSSAHVRRWCVSTTSLLGLQVIVKS